MKGKKEEQKKNVQQHHHAEHSHAHGAGKEQKVEHHKECHKEQEGSWASTCKKPKCGCGG